MEERKFYYQQILMKKEEEMEEKRRVYLVSQNKIAEEIATKVKFGEIEIIEDSRFGNIALKKVSFEDLEDSYLIEHIKDESYMEYCGMHRKIHIKTFVLTNKNEKEVSLPICIHIKYFIKNVNFNQEKIEIRCNQLLSAYSTEIYSYCFEDVDYTLKCSGKEPIVIIKNQFFCKESEKNLKGIIRKFLLNVSEESFLLHKNEEISELDDTSSIVDISKHLKTEPKSLLDCVNAQIYKKIWDEFSLYLQLNTFNPYRVEYDLLETINMKIEISRKSYVVDITADSREYGVDITLTNRDLDIVFVNVNLKSTVVEENLKYSFKIFKDKGNIKNIVLQYLD